MRKNAWTGKEEACGVQESCVNCYNRNHSTKHSENAFQKLAKAERHRIFKRVGKETSLEDMKRLGGQMYSRWALDERKRIAEASKIGSNCAKSNFGR